MENDTTITSSNETGKNNSNSGWIIASLVTLVIILIGYIIFSQFLSTSSTAMSPTPTRIPTFVITASPTPAITTEVSITGSTTKTPTVTKTPSKTPTPTGGSLQNPPTSTLTPTPRSLSL